MKKYLLPVIYFLSLLILISFQNCSKSDNEAAAIIHKDDSTYLFRGNFFGTLNSRTDTAIWKNLQDFDFNSHRELYSKLGPGIHPYFYMLYINTNGKLDKIRPVKSFDKSMDIDFFKTMKNGKYKQLKDQSNNNIKYKVLFVGNLLFGKDGGPWTPEDTRKMERRVNASLSKMPSNIHEPDYYLLPEKEPNPVGGLDAIASKITYPKEAKDYGIAGKVSVRAFINEKGTVDGVQVLTGIGFGCDSAAFEAVKNTKFEPAYNNKHAVKSQFVIPIYFQANNKIEASRKELDKYSQTKNPHRNKESNDTTYFIAVEQMPEPIGGIKAIQDNVRYPEIAKRAGIEGKIFVKAYIDENGNVTKTQVLKSLGAELDKAAEDAIRKTKFIPGVQDGKKVKVQVAVPIIFKLH